MNVINVKAGLTRFGKYMWNVFALFGIIALMAVSFGIFYSYNSFKYYNASDLLNLKPLVDRKVPVEGGLNIRLDFPDDHIKADIQPIPSVQSELLVATLSMLNPVNKILIFAPTELAVASNNITNSVQWLKDNNNDYSCDVVSLADANYVSSKVNESKLVSINDCERPTNEDEKRISQRNELHNVFYTFELSKQRIIVQMLIPTNSNEERNKNAAKTLSTFAWVK